MNDDQFEVLKSRLERSLGLDLDAYKQAQMRRRITTYIGRSGKTFEEFVDGLASDADELRKLRDMITINVTEFFRDEAQWTQLRTNVLPEVIEAARNAPSIWSAGCSTGQEPYSLAMLLSEAGVLDQSTILGTDFDREVLARSQAGGPYTAEEIKGVPRAQLDRYFTEADGRFTATPDLRKRLKFRELNLLKDRFGRGYDMVVCRNVMIYFTSEVKSDLIARFVESLKPDGILFIGATEALLGDDLARLDRLGGNFYRKRAVDAVRTRVA